jgi:hypothetical protein
LSSKHSERVEGRGGEGREGKGREGKGREEKRSRL